MFIRKCPLADSPFVECGLFNGYVAIPPTNKHFGKDYMDLYEISVHGGVTLSEPVSNRNIGDEIFLDGAKELPNDWWIIGFDTCHCGDTPQRWTKEAVMAETRRLNVELSK